MTRRMAVLTAAAAIVLGGATLATSASARDSFSVSIGVPGVAFGYSNYGVPYYAPPPVYAPAPAPYYYGPPVVYRPYYRPYYYRPHYYGPYAYYRH